MAGLTVKAPMIQYVTKGGKARHASRGDVLDASEIAVGSLDNLKSLGFVEAEQVEAEQVEASKPAARAKAGQ